MSTGNKRPRAGRVRALAIPPNLFRRIFGALRRRDVLIRLGLCALAAIAVWALTKAWVPPLGYRTGFTPQRVIIARVDFEVFDPKATEELRKRKRLELRPIYVNDPKPLQQLQQALKVRLLQIVGAASYEKVDSKLWDEFFPENGKQVTKEVKEKQFNELRKALGPDPKLTKFENVLRRVFSDFERRGLIDRLQHGHGEDQVKGSLSEIEVRNPGSSETLPQVPVEQILHGKPVLSTLRTRLEEEVAAAIPEVQVRPTLVERVYTWFEKKLPSTLRLDEQATEAKARLELDKYREFDNYTKDKSPLAPAGEPLTAEKLRLLEHEHQALLAQLGVGNMLYHSVAAFGMYLAVYTLCGLYIYFRAPRILADLRQFSILLALVVLTVGLSYFVATDNWRAEIVPLVVCGMALAIVHGPEVALLISSAVSLVVVFSLGQGLPEFVTQLATIAASIMFLGRVRSRTKLLYVGLFAGSVALLTTLGVGNLSDQPLAAPLLNNAVWFAVHAIVAALVLTGILPFVEKIFDVQTDISLLELGDAAHPLLQELVRRAPGTYNHSINVASIAEAAADAIGANGLLCRVGAYFHDIGKMLKPGYFIENQAHNENRHDSLAPAMSTLVIIAHVKDGADLARQHHLPQSLIDFIEQHHGTTLVEFFYRQASQQSQSDPDQDGVDENSFRYPGPKPQTREAAVLMLADAVESASRTLSEPSPARIENLVEELAMKRLLDGQFDQCALTLKELRTIQDSLVKSLTAMYHGRVKYPSQQRA